MNEQQLQRLGASVAELLGEGASPEQVARALVLMAVRLHIDANTGYASTEAQRAAAAWLREQVDEIDAAAGLRLPSAAVN
jgi:hypothetical protein